MTRGTSLNEARSKSEFLSVYWRPIMNLSRKLNFISLCALVLLLLPGCSGKPKAAAVSPSGGAPVATAAAKPAEAPKPDARSSVEESQALVLLRGLPTLGTVHSIAIVELNPDATNFGAILQEVELPQLT